MSNIEDKLRNLLPDGNHDLLIRLKESEAREAELKQQLSEYKRDAVNKSYQQKKIKFIRPKPISSLWWGIPFVALLFWFVTPLFLPKYGPFNLLSHNKKTYYHPFENVNDLYYDGDFLSISCADDTLNPNIASLFIDDTYKFSCDIRDNQVHKGVYDVVRITDNKIFLRNKHNKLTLVSEDPTPNTIYLDAFDEVKKYFSKKTKILVFDHNPKEALNN